MSWEDRSQAAPPGQDLRPLVTPNNVSTAPDVDEAGNVYVGGNPASMYSLTPGGQQRWTFSRARFSADGSMAFASAIALGVYDHSFLFGIKTT